ncbi:polysaccharide deacetylase family protein [Paenibacillus sp. KQZ6P-2]|uniref:Polysaccharide deacetylase family protein n=1 Tax=Paenibacillus mangrovi TaxID=2931978 RepID=A0A9X2B350_9BACL|nr:polysaccharide deacetylase family protein [Paenibacillus mangrovi]MCJ8012976.1 polysaccharide deacetylase family protein [Paenibacillus mangrovi]
MESIHPKQRRLRKWPIMLIAAIGLIFFLLIMADNLFFYQANAAPNPKQTQVEVPVLAYHSVSTKATNEYVVTPEQFRKQMSTLHDLGYTSINMQQFDALMKGKIKNTGKFVLITFDDGYADNYKQAFPIMQQYGFTATMFVITNWVGSDSYATWSELSELQKAGWDIMSHTRTHPDLSLMSSKDQTDEIAGSKQAIESHMHEKVNAMAYPYGLRSKDTVEIAKKCGYEYAFTFEDGWTSSVQNPLLLKRIIVSGTEDLPTFRQKLQNRY